jgi:hypothetical protein
MPTAQTGYFVDSAVAGVAYTCGAFSGVTDANGAFNYEASSTCTFKVGGITLGSVAASALLTSVNLVSGAVDETNPTVNNITRFLMSLDTDNDPSNGIQIATSVGTALSSATLNFSLDPNTFATNATGVVNTAIPGRALVSAAAASGHLSATLLGLLAGSYSCTYSGSDSSGALSGTATLMIANGAITGTGADSRGGPGSSFSLNGNVTTSGSATLVGGSTSNGGNFTGSFKNDGSGSGTWTGNNNGSGTWACHKA